MFTFGRAIGSADDSLRSCPGFRLRFAKLTQNAELEKILLATKGTTLVEASPYDRIWGIGLSAKDPRARRRAASGRIGRSRPRET